jgi:hypothetical protein
MQRTFHISIFDHGVGVQLYTVRYQDYMTTDDINNMVNLLHLQLMEPLLHDRSDLRLASVMDDLNELFSPRGYVILANHLTDWNTTLTMNVLAHMENPQSSKTRRLPACARALSCPHVKEVFPACCAFGSPLQKYFAMSHGGSDLQPLDRRCPATTRIS